MVKKSKTRKALSRKDIRRNDVFLLVVTFIIIFFINIISQSWFFRLDLTAEKRYTLSRATREILRNLDDVVYIQVYLKGDLNIPFQNFQDNVRDLLDEFKVYARSSLQYEFIDPFEDVPEGRQNEIINQLYEKGLKPSNIHQRDKGAVSEKIIFPGAILIYNNIEIAVNFLINNPGVGAEQNLNNSIENLEYALISNIKGISNPYTDKIAFIEGHGELNELETHDISLELSKSYQVDRGVINGKPGILDAYKAIIIAKPQQPFSEADKFVIDQYIMGGGKVLWLIDNVNVSLDSLVNGETLAFIAELNLEDMFFRYGTRILPELVQDIQCNVIPVNVALTGNSPDFQPVPWLYHPVQVPDDHPVTRNLNPVICRFVNPVDTIAARKNIRKTPLLTTSAFSKTRKVPAVVSLEEINNTPAQEEFNQPAIMTGVLLEGEFESVFKNRGLDAYFDSIPQTKEKGIFTRMAVIADGDIIRNDIIFSQQGPSVLPLGYDRFTQQSFGNKDFMMNLIQYLTDDANLLELRGREFRLRLLDRKKVSDERLKWTLMNMLVPTFLIIIFGIIFISYRKYRYSKKL